MDLNDQLTHLELVTATLKKHFGEAPPELYPVQSGTVGAMIGALMNDLENVPEDVGARTQQMTVLVASALGLVEIVKLLIEHKKELDLSIQPAKPEIGSNGGIVLP